MNTKTTIEWTEVTWNPSTGCNKISSGCLNCYAERMAKRLQAMRNPNYKNGFSFSIHENVLNFPIKLKKPSKIFVNSMSDLFHEDMPFDFISDIFRVMEKTPHHIYQILTKRSNKMLQLNSQLKWLPNIWMGVTVESSEYYYRIDDLRKSNANIKFLSLEPLLGSLRDIDLTGIDWVIVGGESGPKSRYLDPSWVIELRDKCSLYDIPFFFKQWGGVFKKKNGKELEGRVWNQMPQLQY